MVSPLLGSPLRAGHSLAFGPGRGGGLEVTMSKNVYCIGPGTFNYYHLFFHNFSLRIQLFEFCGFKRRFER